MAVNGSLCVCESKRERRTVFIASEPLCFFYFFVYGCACTSANYLFSSICFCALCEWECLSVCGITYYKWVPGENWSDGSSRGVIFLFRRSRAQVIVTWKKRKQRDKTKLSACDEAAVSSVSTQHRGCFLFRLQTTTSVSEILQGGRLWQHEWIYSCICWQIKDWFTLITQTLIDNYVLI